MMDSFVMYQVGTCDPGLAMRKDCCLLQFFEGIPHVYVLIDRPTEEMLQRANFEKATIEFGLFAHKDVMTLAIKVGDLPWIDAPYSAHLEHGENLPMWNAKNLQVNLLLVDSFDGRILGIRTIGLSEEFSAQMLLEMRKQLYRSFDLRGYQKQIAQIQQRYTPEEIGTKVSSVQYVAKPELRKM